MALSSRQLETGLIAGGSTLANFAMVTLASEGGVAAGSAIRRSADRRVQLEK